MLGITLQFFVAKPRATDLSLASKQFLAKYGLGGQEPDNSDKQSGPIRAQDSTPVRKVQTNQHQASYSPLQYQVSPQAGNGNQAKSQPRTVPVQQVIPSTNQRQVFAPQPVITANRNPAFAAEPNQNPVVAQPKAVINNKQFERVLDISAIRQQSKLL